MSSIALIKDAFHREFTEKIFSDSAKTPIDMVYLSIFFRSLSSKTLEPIHSFFFDRTKIVSIQVLAVSRQLKTLKPLTN